MYYKFCFYFIAGCLFCLGCTTKISDEKKIKYNRNNLFTKYILIGNEHILWDTGAEGSVFFQDFASRKIKLGSKTLIDYNKQKSETPLFYSPSIVFDSMRINNIHYLLVPENEVAIGIKNYGIMGILGMNVIGKANWLIDFTDTTLYILKQKNMPEITIIPNLLLPYQQIKVPIATLVIAETAISNVIIDSGSEADLIFLESDIEQINRYFPPIDITNYFSSSLYNDNIPEKKYKYQNITVNGYTFDELEIVQGKTNRLIGMGFFRKFNKVFLNTKEKEFCFYE